MLPQEMYFTKGMINKGARSTHDDPSDCQLVTMTMIQVLANMYCNQLANVNNEWRYG